MDNADGLIVWIVRRLISDRFTITQLQAIVRIVGLMSEPSAQAEILAFTDKLYVDHAE